MRQVNAVARLSRPKSESITKFIQECVEDTRRTEVLDNALAMYNYAEDVISLIDDEEVTDAATVLSGVALQRLEVLSCEAASQ